MDAEMEDMLDELSPEVLWERFSLRTKDLLDVTRSFEAMKNKLGLKRLHGMDLYRGLKLKLGTQKTWKAIEVFKLLDKRINQKDYMHQTAAKGVRVMIVGAGPVGLRLAIDSVLLGCEVVVVEKRSCYSRNNVLHLWPCTIEDLKQLGAKKFYGKFCAGAIDHVSIRSLQCILLKVCLLLGVRIYTQVEFLEVLEPTDSLDWHAKLNPPDHFLNSFEFDVLVGAEGRRSAIPGFDRKELRGKLALAITANFINYYTRDEAAVDEISGVAFIFNQKFFKDLKSDTGIDLENIVYYKDDTHYFVMTAKKDSLMKKGVLLADYSDTRQLLHPSNIDHESLYDYAVEAADWSTELPRLDFAVNHYNKPDVALFDFTSIYQAEYAARAINKDGKDLYLCVVGDALLEPFWPTGTGCPRGFLSAQDTAWLIRGIGQQRKPLDLLSERESLFCLLPQTIPERLHTNIKAYTIDPQTRYPNFTRRIRPNHVKHLYETAVAESPVSLRQGSVKRKLVSDPAEEDMKENLPDTKKAKEAEVMASPSRRPLVEKGSIQLAYYSEPEEMTLKDPGVLLKWLQEQVEDQGIKITDLSTCWSNGMALCTLIHRYHPELIPNFDKLSPRDAVKNNQLAFSVAEEQFGITCLLKPTELAKPDKLALFTYLSLFYEFFLNKELVPRPAKGSKAKSTPKKLSLIRRFSRKNFLVTSPPSVERSWNTKTVKRKLSLSPPVSPVHEAPMTVPPPAKKQPPAATKAPRPKSQFGLPSTSSDFCYFCNKRVYLMERMSANGLFFHRSCFRCSHCNCQLKIGGYALSKGDSGEIGKFFCQAHYRQLFLSNPEAINYSRAGAVKKTSREDIIPEPVKKEPEPEPEPIIENRISPPDQPLSVVVEDEEFEVLTMDEDEDEDEDEEILGDVEMGEEEPQLMNGDLSPPEVTLSSEPPEDLPEEKMDIQKVLALQPKVLYSPASSRRRRPGNGGMVSQLLAGFEQREAAARGQTLPEPEAEPEPELEQPELEQPEPERAPPRPPKLGSPEPGLAVIKEKMEMSTSLTGSVSLSQTPTLSLLQETLSGTGVVKKWYPFGLALKQDSPKLHRVEKTCRGKPPMQHLSEMLKGWLEKGDSSVTWGAIVTALKEIDEGELAGQVREQYGVVVIRRIRSPYGWKGATTRKVQAEDVKHVPRSSRLNVPHRKRRGQQSVTRSLGLYDTSDVAIQERRRQQQRFREAQLIQREMSQLERQYEELEEVGREIEQALRDAESTSQEDNFMKSWLQLVNERNGLVRKTAELSLKMKELELEDRQYEVDKELSGLTGSPESDWSREDKARFEELCEQKIKIVEERNEIVMQTEEERKRELEEDESAHVMLDEQFGVGRRVSTISTGSDDYPRLRRPSEPNPEAHIEAILQKDKTRHSRVKSWFGYRTS